VRRGEGGGVCGARGSGELRVGEGRMSEAELQVRIWV
jgi:hypothetical protein